MAVMRTLDDLYSTFGGAAVIGRIIDKPVEHAAAMRRRGSIPVEYWPALLSSAKANGIRLTSDMLMAMHAKGRVENGKRRNTNQRF
jgi:hypothetical protein